MAAGDLVVAHGIGRDRREVTFSQASVLNRVSGVGLFRHQRRHSFSGVPPLRSISGPLWCSRVLPLASVEVPNPRVVSPRNRWGTEGFSLARRSTFLLKARALCLKPEPSVLERPEGPDSVTRALWAPNRPAWPSGRRALVCASSRPRASCARDPQGGGERP